MRRPYWDARTGAGFDACLRDQHDTGRGTRWGPSASRVSSCPSKLPNDTCTKGATLSVTDESGGDDSLPAAPRFTPGKSAAGQHVSPFRFASSAHKIYTDS